VSANPAPNKLAWYLVATELLLSLPPAAGYGSEGVRKWGATGVRRRSSWPAMGARRSCEEARFCCGWRLVHGGSPVWGVLECLVCFERAMEASSCRRALWRHLLVVERFGRFSPVVISGKFRDPAGPNDRRAVAPPLLAPSQHSPTWFHLPVAWCRWQDGGFGVWTRSRFCGLRRVLFIKFLASVVFSFSLWAFL
jgi:hypothetical protein